MVQGIDKRKHKRYKPKRNTLISLIREDMPDFTGIAFSESVNGCGGMFPIESELKIGQKCKAKLTDTMYINAVVRWVNKIDEDFMKAGFEFVD